jgi:hypothetical protein
MRDAAAVFCSPSQVSAQRLATHRCVKLRAAAPAAQTRNGSGSGAPARCASTPPAVLQRAPFLEVPVIASSWQLGCNVREND